MESQADSFLTVQIILTIATFGFAGIPVIADFNKTHATNPLWVGHARYHVVWQVLSYVLIGVLALYLIWTPGDDFFFRLNLAALLGFAIYGGFFGAYLTMSMYSGKSHDVNGYMPIRIGENFSIDVNISVFSVFTIVLIVAEYLMHG